MKRIHPLFSLLSIGFALILFTGLGFIMWRNGNMLFSPGELSALNLTGMALGGFTSHAEFETECQLCHAPLETTQDVLCEECHTQIREQIDSQGGTHGKIPGVNRCADCHPDHKGKAFNVVEPAMEKFDHTLVNFSLARHNLNYDHSKMDCMACHETNQGFTTSLEKCAQCHATHDLSFLQQHIQDFGENCLECHDGHDRMTGFDHAQSGFPLEGKHAEVSCADCHGSAPEGLALTGATAQDETAECLDCHAEPAAHQGMFVTDCSDCHTSDAWSPANWEGFAFEHTTASGFSLARHSVDYAGQAMECVACHTGRIELHDFQSCITCHSSGVEQAEFLQGHMIEFGPACLDCHDGADRMANFDHARIFPLEGAHAETACQDCHQNQVFSGTPAQCMNCHDEPNIHAGFFGLQCQLCHSTKAWSPAGLQMHNFPLDHGGQGEVACETCHTSSYTQYTCYGCHEHQPDEILHSHSEENIDLDVLQSCVECHADGRKDES